jgi:hypothetical protein
VPDGKFPSKESINVTFSRQLLAKMHEMARAHLSEIRVIKDASLTHCGNCWTFEGPDKYSWVGRAHNAYHRRYLGWMAWLSSKGRRRADWRLPTTATPPRPSGLTIAASPKLIWMRRLDVWKVRSVQPKPDHVRPQLRKLEP